MNTHHKIKKKKWLLGQQEKRMRQLRRKNKKKSHIGKADVSNKKRSNEHYVKVPDVFSLSKNIENTVAFFAEVFRVINICSRRQKIFFDLSHIQEVTVDAIMYLIAIISNARRLQILEIECGGNMPLNNKARASFEKVGFYDYVQASRKIPLKKDTDRIKIAHGTKANGVITSSICDFVNEKIGAQNNMYTKRLYPMLVELMTNVKQHAYREVVGNMIPEWYVYVENCQSDIRFVFLDTGVGIPSTIRKNWRERINDKVKGIIGSKADDPLYIEAALHGEFRTETKQGHRGKGLPEIYSAIVTSASRLNNLTIVSGHAECNVAKNGIEKRNYINATFEGTLFMWSFEKEAKNANNKYSK